MAGLAISMVASPEMLNELLKSISAAMDKVPPESDNESVVPSNAPEFVNLSVSAVISIALLPEYVRVISGAISCGCLGLMDM